MAKKVAADNDSESVKETKPKRTTKASASKTGTLKTGASKVASKTASKTKLKADTTSEENSNGSKTPAKRKTKEVTNQTKELALAAAQFAIEKKATRVKLIDLTQITSLTDYFVVASGDSDKQVKAIAENVVVQMRDEFGQGAWRTEGWETNHWVIIDFIDFVVHVFQEDARLYYNLERLYSDAPQEEIADKGLQLPKTRKRKTVTVQSDLIREEDAEASDDTDDTPRVKIISKTDKL